MKELIKAIQIQFGIMCQTGKLFKSQLSGVAIWKAYLLGFNGDPIFRDPKSSTHNCNYCNNFIRRYGNIISINKKGEIETLFSNLSIIPEDYRNSVKIIDNLLKSHSISDIFVESFENLREIKYEQVDKRMLLFRLGYEKNVKRYTREEAEKFGVVKPNEIRTFNHFYLDILKQFVDQSGESVESIQAFYRDKKNVFERAIKEISLDTLNLVKDLINQGSLLDGTAHLHSIDEFITLKKQKESVSYEVDEWYWDITYNMDERTAKFRNTLIGTLCSELTEGEELNKACLNWNKRVDPANYHKASAPITQKQIEEAKKFVQENGYEESFNRRLAVLDDIKASEIKHMNIGSGELKNVSIFDNVKKSTSTQHKRSQFDSVEEVGIEKFLKDILPSCTSIEAFMENRMEGNLVTMTTSVLETSKPIFKWDNNYSWTFNGNLAGKSQIKEAVKTKGGKVDGVLRFSIMWAENDPSDNSDLDAWCKLPNGGSIGFNSKIEYQTKGSLDVDIQMPSSYNNKGIVENITFPTLSLMPDGVYTFWVNNFNGRGSKGFKAEIEFNGDILEFEYNHPLTSHQNIGIAEILLRDGQFSVVKSMKLTSSSKNLWNLDTNNFHKVNLICNSPNHWGDNKVGNLHYMFMIEGCKTDNKIRGFHNENLITELLDHRKVMEVLGASSMIDPTNKQLSGLGFNSTVKDELIVRCSGNFKRIIKIKF